MVVQITFDLGEPFQPFNQLMGVFPAGSKHALPKPLQPLFDDPNSPILDFYPKDFKVDMNGKRFAWQGVALLPFIDESRLLEATQPIIDSLPDAERRRNERCGQLPCMQLLLLQPFSSRNSSSTSSSAIRHGNVLTAFLTALHMHVGDPRACLRGGTCPLVT